MQDSTDAGSRRIQSVDQAFTIVDYVEECGEVTLSEVAEKLDMAVSTAHIHLSTLVHNGYLIKEDSKYRCSFKLLRKGGRMRDGMTLFQVARPELDDLQQSTGEHANLMVEEEGYVVQLYKSQGPETVDDDAPVGKYFYPHTTATGKAILAEYSDEYVRELISEQGLPGFTDHTISDEETLYGELETIRDRGYSINREEHYPGVAAVGVAIESGEDQAIGAISVSGPHGRIDQDRIQNEIAPALQTKKNVVELRMRQQTKS